MSYAERQIIKLLRAIALDNPDVIEVIRLIEVGEHLDWTPNRTLKHRRAA
jgi:hypothetical protein